MTDDRFTHLADAIDAATEREARTWGEVFTSGARRILVESPERHRYADVIHQLGCLLLDASEAQARLMRRLGDELDDDLTFDGSPPAA